MWTFTIPKVVTNPHDVTVAAAAGSLYWVEGIVGNDRPTATEPEPSLS